MKRQLALTVVLLGTTVIGMAQNSASGPIASTGPEPDKQTIPSVDQPKVSVSSAGPSYSIGPGDVLHVDVWKEPDLTATLPVRSDGMISLPLLNDIPAAGLSPMQLAALLTQRLRKYIATPRVTVLVTETKPKQIYVVGEVLHTGPISLLPHMTVLQALATAGLTQFANTKGIYVLRTDNGRQTRMPFNYKQVIKGEASAQNIFLNPGDTLVVP